MADEPADQAPLNIQQPAGPPVLIVTSTRHMKTLSITESEMQQLQSISGTGTIFFSIASALASKSISYFADYYSLPSADPKAALASSNGLIWGFFAFVFVCGALYFQTTKHNTVQLIKRESNYPAEETLNFFPYLWDKLRFWRTSPKKKGPA